MRRPKSAYKNEQLMSLFKTLPKVHLIFYSKGMCNIEIGFNLDMDLL